MYHRMLPIGRKLQVAVIGAGMAGLRASDILLQHGIEVTVYEARDRIGGRVGQSTCAGRLVDLGPNWIHGTSGNPLFEIAKQTETSLYSWPEKATAYDEQGQLIPENDCTEASEAFWGIMSDASKYSNDCSETIDVGTSLMDYIQEKAHEKYADEDEGVASYKRNLIIREAEVWGSFVGSETVRQSLKFFWLEECLEGENPYVADTYQKILDKVAQPLLKAAKLSLNTRVTEINYDQELETVEVGLEDGTSKAFDEVITTFPLGYLKQNKSQFKPPLPSRMSTAIDAINYGTLDKVYVSFSQAWWNKPSDASNGEASDISFTAFNFPQYANDSNPKSWTQHLVNLAALPSPCAQATLLFYVFGECSPHIAELSRHGKQALMSFFEPYYARLPNYDTSKEVCVPIDILSTAWAADDLAGNGSYSNFQIGLDKGDEDIKVMRTGLPERRTWLAGEHTAPFAALGTATGAYWSGEGVAKKIVEIYKLE